MNHQTPKESASIDRPPYRQLRMNATPPEGPYDWYEVVVEDTQEVIFAGPTPIDMRAVRAAIDAFQARELTAKK